MDYVYGALLLHKSSKEINEENLKRVIAATGVEVDETKIKMLIASLKGVDIATELENASAVTAVPMAAGGATGAEKKEEKKEEEKPAESAAGLSSLFG